MKIPPLTNFEKFKKRHWKGIDWPENSELLWYGMNYTYHYNQRKNAQKEGIQIRWNGNPFGLDYNYDYILEK